MVDRVKNLVPNPKNPRKISDAKLDQLRKAIHEFGDLSGFIFNRKTKTLVSGHQRAKVFDQDAKIKYERQLDKPTSTGTVAEGYVVLDGERFKYREVVWDEVKEKAAAIAANHNAGVWDDAQLGGWLRELDEFSIGDLSMFDKKERDDLLASLEPKQKKEKVSRSASDDVQQIVLSFSKENYDEFQSHLQFFQTHLQIANVTDTISKVLESARVSLEEELAPPTKRRAKG